MAEFSGGSVVTPKKTLVRAKGICRLCKSETAPKRLFDIYGARKMKVRDRSSYKMKVKTLFDIDIQQEQGKCFLLPAGKYINGLSVCLSVYLGH